MKFDIKKHAVIIVWIVHICTVGLQQCFCQLYVSHMTYQILTKY